MSEPQSAFVARSEALWAALETELDDLESRSRPPSADFPVRYRRVCQHLALARARLYAPALIDRLNTIAARGHHQLYQGGAVSTLILRGLMHTFPARVRAEWRLVLVAGVLFYGALAAMVWALHVEPSLVHSVFDAETIANYEAMYDASSDRFLRERAADSDILMFGFYVRNNTGIGLKTFASGLLAGLGTLFILVFNGVSIGATLGHLHNVGHGGTVFPFIIGHSALELTAIHLSGVAGLRLGLGVLAPGQHRRRDAVAMAARQALPIVLGMGAMFIFAAFIEAFWSSRHTLSDGVRYGVGGTLWLLVGGYFLLAGRWSSDAS